MFVVLASWNGNGGGAGEGKHMDRAKGKAGLHHHHHHHEATVLLQGKVSPTDPFPLRKIHHDE